MKKSPFIRIREKNLEINSLKDTISAIAVILGCKPTLDEIAKSIDELFSFRNLSGKITEEYEALKQGMGKIIADRVEKEVFNLKLTNIKLEDKVASLQSIIDNKDSKISNQKEIINGNKKGFWDFLYKLFNLQ